MPVPIKTKLIKLLELFETQTNVNSNHVARDMLSELSKLTEDQQDYVLTNSGVLAKRDTPSNIEAAMACMERIAKKIEAYSTDLTGIVDANDEVLKKGDRVKMNRGTVSGTVSVPGTVAKVYPNKHVVVQCQYDGEFTVLGGDLEVVNEKTAVKLLRDVCGNANVQQLANLVQKSPHEILDNTFYLFNLRVFKPSCSWEMKNTIEDLEVEHQGKRKRKTRSNYDDEAVVESLCADPNVTRRWALKGLPGKKRKNRAKKSTMERATKKPAPEGVNALSILAAAADLATAVGI